MLGVVTLFGTVSTVDVQVNKNNRFSTCAYVPIKCSSGFLDRQNGVGGFGVLPFLFRCSLAFSEGELPALYFPKRGWVRGIWGFSPQDVGTPTDHELLGRTERNSTGKARFIQHSVNFLVLDKLASYTYISPRAVSVNLCSSGGRCIVCDHGSQLLAARGRRGGLAPGARSGVLPGVPRPGALRILPRRGGRRASLPSARPAHVTRPVGERMACRIAHIPRGSGAPMAYLGFPRGWRSVRVRVPCERPREAERRRVSVLYRGRIGNRRPRVC